MTALTITPANVKKVTGTQPTRTQNGIAGASVTAGQALYLDTASKLQPCAIDTAAHALVVGIALGAAAADQPLVYAIPDGGLIDLGAVLDIGKIYCAAAAGGIAPVDDIASTNFVTVVGIATAANRLSFRVQASGVQAASNVA